jgi:hypothetical protein
VHKIKASDKKERDPDDQEKRIIDIPAGVPDNDEDRECDGDTGEFHNPVKEDIVLETDKIQDSKGCNYDYSIQQVDRVKEQINKTRQSGIFHGFPPVFSGVL